MDLVMKGVLREARYGSVWCYYFSGCGPHVNPNERGRRAGQMWIRDSNKSCGHNNGWKWSMGFKKKKIKKYGS